jgi:hypothetical protein
MKKSKRRRQSVVNGRAGGNSHQPVATSPDAEEPGDAAAAVASEVGTDTNSANQILDRLRVRLPFFCPQITIPSLGLCGRVEGGAQLLSESHPSPGKPADTNRRMSLGPSSKNPSLSQSPMTSTSRGTWRLSVARFLSWQKRLPQKRPPDLTPRGWEA